MTTAKKKAGRKTSKRPASRKRVAQQRKPAPKVARRGTAPTHPGAILREDVLPALGVKVKPAAEALGISRQTLHRILAETAPVTPDMAVRLGKFCGNGPELWLSMQAAHDLWHSEKRMRAEIRGIKPARRVAA